MDVHQHQKLSWDFGSARNPIGVLSKKTSSMSDHIGNVLKTINLFLTRSVKCHSL